MGLRVVLCLALTGTALLGGCSVNQYFLGENGSGDGDAGITDDGGGDEDGGSGPCIPAPELCDDADNDCDGKVDEMFHLDQDPANCGACGTKCEDSTGTMSGACMLSNCMYTCLPGLNDVDPGVPGCEYACISTGTVDACDGLDNDCDGDTDEDTVLPGGNFCKSAGACTGAAPACSYDACSNRTRIHCTYGSNVEIDPLTCDVSAQETPCDEVDNDCDAAVDESFPTKGAACDDGLLGVCRTTGVVECNTLGDGVECVLTGTPQTSSNEDCNGKDDDCDGDTDEDSPGVQVTVGAVKVDAYEASRPDATALTDGVISTIACSKPLVLPWSTVTKTQAEQACAAAGKRLCTATEWQAACSGAGNRSYPYGNSYQQNTCNGNDYDANCTGADDDSALPTGTPYGCPTKPALSACVSTTGAYDMSGNLKEWTSTAAGSGAFKVRGGAFDSPAGGLSCVFDFVSMDPSFAFPNLGFRCCEDL